jgi:hypothetical protein
MDDKFNSLDSPVYIANKHLKALKLLGLFSIFGLVSLSISIFINIMTTQSQINKVASVLIICNLLLQAPSQQARSVANQSAFPGIFISDTQKKWNTVQQKNDSKHQFGYVICNGGYLGSPLIPNRKAVVDKFLSHCATGKRIGPGLLPVIESGDSHSEQSLQKGYSAYKFALNGQDFYVDLTLQLDLTSAAQSDAIDDTVNYAEITELTHREITTNPVNLIEKLVNLGQGIFEI